MPPSVPAETVAFWENALQKVAESPEWKREYWIASETSRGSSDRRNSDRSSKPPMGCTQS